MAKEFISLGLKEKPPRIGEYEKEPEEGAVKFEKKSFEELTESGEQRMEAAAAKIGLVKNSIKERFGSLFSKAKGVSKESLKVALSAPEIASYGLERGKTVGREAYEGVTDKVNGAMGKAGVYLNEKQQAVVNKASDGYKWFENGAVKALTTFKAARTNIMEKVEQRRKEKEKEKDVLGAVEAKTKWLGFEKLLKDKYGLKLEQITNE